MNANIEIIEGAAEGAAAAEGVVIQSNAQPVLTHTLGHGGVNKMFGGTKEDTLETMPLHLMVPKAKDVAKFMGDSMAEISFLSFTPEVHFFIGYGIAGCGGLPSALVKFVQKAGTGQYPKEFDTITVQLNATEITFIQHLEQRIVSMFGGLMGAANRSFRSCLDAALNLKVTPGGARAGVFDAVDGLQLETAYSKVPWNGGISRHYAITLLMRTYSIWVNPKSYGLILKADAVWRTALEQEEKNTLADFI